MKRVGTGSVRVLGWLLLSLGVVPAWGQSASSSAPSAPAVASAEFRPITTEQLEQGRQQVRRAVADLDRFLQGGPAANAQAWKNYLNWDALQQQVADGQAPDAETLNGLVGRFYMGEPGLELPRFTALRDALVGYLRLVQAQSDAEIGNRLAENLRVIEESVPQARVRASAHLVDVAARVGWLEQLGQAPEVVDRVRREFAYPNLSISASAYAISKGFSEPISEVTPVNEMILGTHVRGTAHTQGTVTARLIPNPQMAVVELDLNGVSHSNTVGRQHPVTIFSRGVTQIHAEKRIFIDTVGLTTQPACARCSTDTQICDIRPDARLGAKLIEKVAWKKAGQQQPAAEQVSSRKAEARIASRLDQQVLSRIADTNSRLSNKLRQPLKQRNIYPDWVHFSSGQDRLLVSARQATRGQLAAATAPPAVAPHHVTVQIHETMFTNTAINAIGGLTITDERARDLVKEVTGEVPPELELKQDEDPWSITFDLQQPVSVELQDNQVTIAIRGRRFTRGEQVVSQTTQIAATYKIEIVDGRAQLVRQGGVDVSFPGKDGDRLSLAELRNKTFFANKFEAFFKPTIAGEGLKLTERWAKLGQMALVHASSQAGWLSLGWN